MNIQYPELKKGLVLTACAITLIALQQFAEVPFHGAFVSSFSNSMHIAMFACLTQLIYWAHPAIRLWQIASIILVIAVSTEALQFVTSGSPSFGDLVRDLAGFAIAAAVHHAVPGTPRKIAALVLLTSLATFTVPGIYLYANYTKHRNFPQLFEPGAWPQKLLVDLREVGRVSTTHNWVQYADQPVIEFSLNASRWPGIYIREPYEYWQQHEFMRVDTFNPESEPVVLNVSLRHKPDLGVPYTLSSILAPGFNQLRLPLENLIYLSDGSPAAIGNIAIFSHGRFAGKKLWLGRIWLE